MTNNKKLQDSFGRKINYLRLSITDRCNFRCFYCKPIKEFKYISHSEVLRYEDLYFLLRVLKEYGIKKLRVTGGEPFVRKGLIDFLYNSIKIIKNTHLTTNGYFLYKHIKELKKINIKSINVSLDTFSKNTFFSITGFDGLNQVLKGIYESNKKNLNIKINTVIMKKNIDELFNFIEFSSKHKIPVRFIELMPISRSVQTQFLPINHIKSIIKRKFTLLPLISENNLGPAKYYKIKENEAILGFIAAITENFCSTCNKFRITANGNLRVCLARNNEISLKQSIKTRNKEKLIKNIKNVLNKKPYSHNMKMYKPVKGKNMYYIGG